MRSRDFVLGAFLHRKFFVGLADRSRAPYTERKSKRVLPITRTEVFSRLVFVTMYSSTVPYYIILEHGTVHLLLSSLLLTKGKDIREYLEKRG